MNEKKFNYEEIKKYVEQGINSNYKAYSENTVTANEIISTYINNGLSSAVNSPLVGRWFASTWESNTTYAENFQKNFVEWSQAIYNAMTENKMTEEEIHQAMLPELVYKGYSVDNSVYTGNSASMMIKTDVAYTAFDKACQESDGRSYTTVRLQHLLTTYPESKEYIYDQAKDSVIKKYGIKTGKAGEEKLKSVPIASVKNPIEREIITYRNKYGRWPTSDEVTLLTVESLRAHDGVNRENNRVEAMMQ